MIIILYELIYTKKKGFLCFNFCKLIMDKQESVCKFFVSSQGCIKGRWCTYAHITNEESMSLYQRARLAFDSGNFNRALILFEKLRAFSDKPSAPVFYFIAYCHKELKHYNDALKYIEAAMFNEDDVPCYHGFYASLYHYHFKDYKVAKKHYKKALQLYNQNNIDSYKQFSGVRGPSKLHCDFGLLLVTINDNDYQMAKYHFKESINISNGRYPYAFFNLARLYEKENKYNKAAKYYEKSIYADTKGSYPLNCYYYALLLNNIIKNYIKSKKYIIMCLNRGMKEEKVKKLLNIVNKNIKKEKAFDKKKRYRKKYDYNYNCNNNNNRNNTVIYNNFNYNYNYSIYINNSNDDENNTDNNNNNNNSNNNNNTPEGWEQRSSVDNNNNNNTYNDNNITNNNNNSVYNDNNNSNSNNINNDNSKNNKNNKNSDIKKTVQELEFIRLFESCEINLNELYWNKFKFLKNNLIKNINDFDDYDYLKFVYEMKDEHISYLLKRIKRFRIDCHKFSNWMRSLQFKLFDNKPVNEYLDKFIEYGICTFGSFNVNINNINDITNIIGQHYTYDARVIYQSFRNLFQFETLMF